MNEQARVRTRRGGFTLIEILVTLVLIALLVGVVLPAVIRQVDRGEPTRVAQDLEAIRSAVQMFRIDVRRFPGTPEQLVYDPDAWEPTFDQDHDDNPIPAPLKARWAGPYLEIGGLVDVEEAPDQLVIALGIEAALAFSTNSIGTTTWLTLDFENATEALAEALSEIIDGNTDIESGRLRFDDQTDILTYYIVPIS